MKPAPFTYLRARSVDEAIALLVESGEDAKVLAGGQSLVAMMNLRLARPTALIDLAEVPGLSYVLASPDDGLRIGAMTRHAQIERYPADLGPWELLQRSARWVGHYPIRTQGTFGGSIAHADPVAEWCILATLLDAVITVRGPGGSRSIPAQEFFEGYFTTALAPDEVLTEVRFPTGTRHGSLQEFARRHGDFAIVAAAVAFDVEDGTVLRPRISLGGVDAAPIRVLAVEVALDGAPIDDETWRQAGALVADAIDPPSDGSASSDYRRSLATALVRRAFTEAAAHEDAPG